jgi:hypothetical protein
MTNTADAQSPTLGYWFGVFLLGLMACLTLSQGLAVRDEYSTIHLSDHWPRLDAVITGAGIDQEGLHGFNRHRQEYFPRFYLNVSVRYRFNDTDMSSELGRAESQLRYIYTLPSAEAYARTHYPIGGHMTVLVHPYYPRQIRTLNYLQQPMRAGQVFLLLLYAALFLAALWWWLSTRQPNVKDGGDRD